MKFTAIVFSATVLKTSKLLLQLMLLLGHGEAWSRRTTKRTQRSDNFITTSYTTTSSENYLAVSAFKDVHSDNLELDDKFDWYQPLLKSCRLQIPDEKNIILSYLGHHSPLMKADDAVIPHGSTLVARCPILGKMKLVGTSSIQCNHGKWSDKLPTCISTTPADGFSQFIDDHPPTIIANIPNGSAGENTAGELVVRPQSVVHLDCIFYRRLGNPTWKWTNFNGLTKNYPFGWAVAREERLWRFRISIFSIQPQDEGEYSCVTPHGHTNSIRIIVQTIRCSRPPLLEVPLWSTTEGFYAGQKQFFFCTEGYKLQGPNSSECLTSGYWSENRFPVCELIQCPYDIDGADPRLEFDFLNGVGYKAMVKFSCPSGYHLTGPTNATCTEDMNWFPSPPTCEAVECAVLLPPLNGRIIDSGSSHFVGDVVKFSCNRNFQLFGMSEISCTENGTWSSPAPHCQIFCPHPGNILTGNVTPDKVSYEIGSSVQIVCPFGTKLQGRKWLVCQQDGTWSSSIGTCVHDSI